MVNETKKFNLKENLHFNWVLPIFIHPKKAIKNIIEQEKPVWLTPLLILSVLVVLAGLVAWPIRRNAIIDGFTMPQDFQYYSSEQQTQFMEAQASQSSALMTFIFPVLGSLIGLWIFWFLTSSILHMGHFISGSPTDKGGYFNLVAWVMSPFMVRQVIQILAMLISQKPISAAGLSGFVSGTGAGAGYLAGILGQVDLYFIWMIVLLLLGIVPLSGLMKTKSWAVAAGTLLIMVLLMAVPQFIQSIISGFSSSGMYY
jgi:hypothetical protein